ARDGPRRLMPSSRKGRGHKRIERYPIPIPASLAAWLRQAAGEREASDPLLPKANGHPWGHSDHGQPFQRAATRAGLDPAKVTFYALRHSSIVRALLAGVPVRLVAVAHDTSIPMIEKNYSRYISDHADAVLRRALLDTAQPAAGKRRLAAGAAIVSKVKKNAVDFSRHEWVCPVYRTHE